jgi:hypothetical protein
MYPSAARIIERIPKGFSCEWMILNAAVRRAQKVLGIPK